MGLENGRRVVHDHLNAPRVSISDATPMKIYVYFHVDDYYKMHMYKCACGRLVYMFVSLRSNTSVTYKTAEFKETLREAIESHEVFEFVDMSDCIDWMAKYHKELR